MLLLAFCLYRYARRPVKGRLKPSQETPRPFAQAVIDAPINGA